MNEVKVQWTGLVTNSSKYTSKPGYVKEAENVVFEKPNTASCRRGFTEFFDTTKSSNIKEIFEYAGAIHMYYGTTLAYWKESNSTVVEYTGTITAASKGLRPLVWNDSLYICTTAGVQKISSLGTAPVLSGVPAALGGTAAANASNPWLVAGDSTGNGNAVAYRVVWGINGNNGAIILGRPSERIDFVVAPGQADCSVDLTIQIPTGITTSHFLQVYRSKSTGTDDYEGSDEMGQVYEYIPNSTDIDTNKYVTINDIVIDDLIGATLYTSPTQEGILEGNSQPPVAKDICLFKEHAVYGNITLKHRAIFTILGIGTSGFKANDTIVIDSKTFTGKASETVGSKFFKVFTAGNASQNIADTARSLVSIINQQTDCNFKAVYLSGFEELPGKILIERVTNAQSSFTVTATTAIHTADPANYALSPADVEGGSLTSDNTDLPNAVMVSKYAEIEAVPEKNIYECGENDSAIVRIFPISDRVFIFKDNGDVYTLTGDDNFNFTVQLYRRIKLYGYNTIAKLNDAIYCYTDQGVVMFNQYGYKIVSEDVDEDIKNYLRLAFYSTFDSAAWAIASESDGRYILYTPADGVDGDPAAKMWVYQADNNAWSIWTMNRACGMVRPSNDRIYFANGDLCYEERKDSTEDWGLDFADRWNTGDATAVSADGLTITLADNFADAIVGWEFFQVIGAWSGDTWKLDILSATITAIDTDLKTVTVDADAGFSADYGTYAAEPIDAKITFEAIGGAPGEMKLFREVQVGFRDKNRQFYATVKNNFYSEGTGKQYKAEPSFYGSCYGDGEYAEYPWGGLLTAEQLYRIAVPSKYMNCMSLILTLEVNKAFTTMEVDKVVFYFEGASERVNSNATISAT